MGRGPIKLKGRATCQESFAPLAAAVKVMLAPAIPAR